MKADFSEFTYGFSLVNELASALSCTAVPIFPSLVEEGREGGGFDVKLLSNQGKILNLQFKLSERMKAPNSREYKISGHSLALPYYRFAISSRRISRQHPLLLALEAIEPLTFYAAPEFHENDEIHQRWNAGSVTSSSVFVRPTSIGRLPDLKPHRICFDEASLARKKAYLFSEPREIDTLSFEGMSEAVFQAVDGGPSTLRESLDRARGLYTSALEQAHQEVRRHLLLGDASDDPGLEQISGEYRPDEHMDRDLERLEGILSERADGQQLLRQVAQVTTGIFGALPVAIVRV